MKNFQELNFSELTEINGGKTEPTPVATAPGYEIVVNTGLAVLGFFAGLTDGLTDGMND